MKRIVQLLALVGFASFGAPVPALAEPGAPIAVGDLGRPSALVIQGNQSFTSEQILAGLKLRLDFHVAAHPAAPLADFLATLKRQIGRGYLRAGFPSVQVQATVEADRHHIVVQVQEGPRYGCGEILLCGLPSMTNDVVRHKIAQEMARLEDITILLTNLTRTNVDAVAWIAGKPAPFDVAFSELLTNRVQEALTALGCFQPRFTTRIVPDSARRLADLKIEFTDEGIKGTISEIEVSGLHTNTRPQLLDYLELKPGMELSATLVTATSNQLWLSGRFFRHDVSLVPLPSPGQFKLALDLEEVREASPLDQEFSPEEKALLRFRDWLAGWEARADDLVISANFTNLSSRGSMDLVVSPSGTALAVREASSDDPARLQYALVASKELIGLYSVWRQCKFEMPRSTAGGHVLLRFRPASPESYGNGDISFQILLGLRHSQPFRLELELQPAVFVSAAHWMDTSLKDGVLTVSQLSDDVRQTIHIDVATGRLNEASWRSAENGEVLVEIRAGIGSFAELQREVLAATAEQTNCYVSNRGFTSWASFLVTDLLTPPRVERALGWYAGETVSRQSKAVLGLARGILNSRNLDAAFEPLNRLFCCKPNKDGEKYFVVPVEAPPGGAPTDPQAVLAVVMLNASDGLVPGGSWPEVLIRESAFTVAGRNLYTQSELDKLLKSEDVGPVGCLATACLLGKINPKLARAFGERGLVRLNLDEFRKDYLLLLRTNFIIGDLAGNVIGLLNGVDVAKLTPMLEEFGPDEAAFLRQVSQLLAEGNGQPLADILWPAIEQHWEEAPRHYLEAGLTRFLPQVQFLTNSQALYDRGRMLLSPDSLLHDVDEAAQCYRKAAAQGHARAQVSYGHLCEAGEGVPQNFAEAMSWYRKAAEQKQTHAMCSIAAMYHFAKGVPQDLDEAARWYHLELDLKTEEKCVFSLLNLGLICEANHDMELALKWYRLAAEAGARPAQAKLGDLLSDGLFTKPDFMEACQWLTLAAAAGDKVSEVRLRSLRDKLGVEQLADVKKRADAITQRLEEKEKEREKRAE